MEYDYDLFVIGAGSGGVRAARMAAALGVRVAVAEHDRLGGTCVNVGCVPKKLMVYASNYAREFEDAAGFGWSVGDRSHNWATLIAHKDAEIERLNGIYQRLLENSGVRIVRGKAVLADPHTVQVGEQSFTAKNILVCPGGWPHMPDIPGKELLVSSNEIFAMRQLPKRIAVLGGGYIGVEFAGIFQGLGADVTLVHRGEHLLRGFDHDVREHLGEELEKQGMKLLLGHHLQAVHKTEDGSLAVELQDNFHVEADLVLCACGRRPRTKGLGLEEAGVKLDAAGAVCVDDYLRTDVPHIFAIGDVCNRLALTPVALAEGMAVVKTLFQDRPTRPDHELVPTAVFSQPEVGTVGISETEAREHYGNVVIYKSTFKALKHTLSGRDESSLMKLVVDGDTDRVLGLHIVGDHAGEITQGFAVAIKMGATKADFDATIGIHPTAAEELVTMRTPVGA